MPAIRPTRGAQPISTGLGVHFVSPKKARDPKKMQMLVHIPGANSKHKRLLAQMAALMNPQMLTTQTPSSSSAPAQPEAPANFDDTASYPYDQDDSMVNDYQPDKGPCPTDLAPEDLGHRILPDKMANNLYTSWKALIPTLVDPHLKYSARTHGHPLAEICPVISACASSGCVQRQFSIVCLFFDHKQLVSDAQLQLITSGFLYVNVMACKCSTLSQVLVHHGLFPTAPSQPRMAISTDLLAFYWALFERFQMTNTAGQVIQEPFRRGLGQAIQCTNLSRACLQARSLQCNEEASLSTPKPSNTSLQGQCAAILMQRCPACFGGVLFGRPLSEGGDIHVATDGNFHHRHRRSAGDCPHFYEPSYFLPKTQVDDVGRRIISKRKRAPKIHPSVVLDEAIDQCEHSYEAADGKKQKAAMESFDDTGIMALICRHDIPLFFANIDSPGEQQKYVVSLIEHLFSLIPQEATVVTLYDVGCVLSRSLSQYDILPEPVTSRLRFATTAMHAYGHEWACQLEYNPRMCSGLGLSDSEGTERLWSRFVKLIGIQRSSSRQRRLWLIDRQAGAIGLEMRTDLGEWIKQRLKRGVNAQGAAAKDVLNKCDIEIEDLEDQWADQKKSQLSICAHAPARLKKELDIVLALQADLNASDRALQATRTVVEKGSVTEETLDALESLERSHDRLMNKVEVLYASLNVHDRFPELKGVDLDFIRTLLMARDLKINIRKRAIGSFFEWDKLDRAVGGANQALGTKLHQQTCKAIAKRQPALMTAIRKFNSYCERLENLYDLPTKLADLRNDPTLMEDVWITPSVGDVPRWMEDTDRCLGLEADNLCRWFRDELAVLEVALHSPANHAFLFPLQQWRDHVLQLQTKWVTLLASSIRFVSNITVAVNLAITLCEGPSEDGIYRLVPTSLALDEPSPENDTDEYTVPAFEEAVEEAVLMDVLPDGTISDDEDDEVIAEPEFTISWELPENLHTDTFKVPCPEDHVIVPCSGTPPTRVRPAQDGFPYQVFEPRDQSFLAQPTARLNDTCINGCAALLYSEILMNSHVWPCAIFSTHDLPRIRYKASDEILWWNTVWTSFWDKDVWILPIHRPSPVGHWVFCAIYISTKELHLFDSLAERRPWKNDVKDIMNLIARLSFIAHQRCGSHKVDLKGWVAHPLTVNPLQTNNYDCGLWVLAALAAVVRGAHRPGMHEEDMIAFRHYVRTLVVRIPAP
ncbi:hypothetical protein F4604DRAFT_1923085 [Suillus subluteus]|nr:hypothetical protein F4604DRAFT_1923085 [Suillus subluteus]